MANPKHVKIFKKVTFSSLVLSQQEQRKKHEHANDSMNEEQIDETTFVQVLHKTFQQMSLNVGTKKLVTRQQKE